MLALSTLVLVSCQVFAYEAPTAIDQLKIDAYLMMRHLPEIGKRKHKSVLEIVAQDLDMAISNIASDKLSSKNRALDISPDIALEAAFRTMDLVLFGKQSKSKELPGGSNFVVNHQDWGFEDATDEDIDNGIPVLIAYALNLASKTIENRASHKAEVKDIFKQKINTAKSKMQSTKNADYKEHLDMALAIIKADLLYSKWRQHVFKEATRNREENLANFKRDNDGESPIVTESISGIPGGVLYYAFPEEEKAIEDLNAPFWTWLDEQLNGPFVNTKWSDVDWDENDYAYGLFEDYADDSSIKDRLSAPIFNPKKNQSKDSVDITNTVHKLKFNIKCLHNQGLAIEDYDKNNKFNSFLVPEFINRSRSVGYSSLDMDFLNYIYMSYVNLYSVLESDYKKQNKGKFHFIPRLHPSSNLLHFLIVGSKLYNTDSEAKEFIDSFKLSDIDKNNLHDHFKSLTGNKHLDPQLYCYTSDSPTEPLSYVHVSNKIGKGLKKEGTNYPNWNIMLNSLGIAVEKNSSIAPPIYYSTHDQHYLFYDLSPAYNSQGSEPPIYYYTDTLNGSFFNHNSYSDKVYIHAKRLKGEASIADYEKALNITLEVEEIEEQQIEYFVKRVLRNFVDLRSQYLFLTNTISKVQLLGHDVANKFSFAQVQELLKRYEGFSIEAEKIAGGYSFSIYLKD